MFKIGDEVILTEDVDGLGTHLSWYVVTEAADGKLRLRERIEGREINGLWDEKFFEKIYKPYETVTIPLDRYERLIIAEYELMKLREEN